jgi:hypothetical protein
MVSLLALEICQVVGGASGSAFTSDSAKIPDTSATIAILEPILAFAARGVMRLLFEMGWGSRR